MNKPELRQTVLNLRRQLSPYARLAHEQKIAQRLFSSSRWKSARSIGCYLSLPDEVATDPIFVQGWQEHKQMSAPVIHRSNRSLTFHRIDAWEGLETGPLGIRQPLTCPKLGLSELDLILVPGVAFDTQGYRLGYGHGYFDHTLAERRIPCLGLAFQLQIVDLLPIDPWDVPVGNVLTEEGWVIPLPA